MDVQKEGLRLLIRSAIVHKPEKLPEGFSLKNSLRMIRRLQITSIALEGALLCGISPDEPEMKLLAERSGVLYALSLRQMEEIRRLCALFDGHQIDYMLLKGSNMKELYSEPHLREMSDADILIRVEQYDRIKPLMKQLGYSFADESDHELCWTNPSLHLELHKLLIPSNNKRFYAYFRSGWSRAVRLSEGSSRYVLSKEDELIYITAHFSKHYRDGGIGAKHLIDLWLFLRENPQLNSEYVEAELEKLGLDCFYRNLLDTAETWFADREQTEITELISEAVLGNGAYGTHGTQYVASVAKITKDSGSARRGRFKRVAYLFFPPFRTMKRMYPVLKYAPFLLPVFWIVRWFTAVLFKRQTVKKRQKETRKTTPEVINQYLVSLEKVGLYYDR